jgi:hypothetical protein
MTQPKTNTQSQSNTLPQQVWATLTAAQQQTIVQTIVRVCQNLVTQWKQETENEPASKC